MRSEELSQPSSRPKEEVAESPPQFLATESHRKQSTCTQLRGDFVEVSVRKSRHKFMAIRILDATNIATFKLR